MGVKWIPSLYYQANRNNGQGGEEVKCEKFKVAYDKDKGTYKVVVPRKCMDEAPDKIKVRAEGDNYASPVPGEAGPTKALAARLSGSTSREPVSLTSGSGPVRMFAVPAAPGHRPDRVRALHDQADPVLRLEREVLRQELDPRLDPLARRGVGASRGRRGSRG